MPVSSRLEAATLAGCEEPENNLARAFAGLATHGIVMPIATVGRPGRQRARHLAKKWKYELGNCRESSDTRALNNIDLEPSQ